MSILAMIQSDIATLDMSAHEKISKLSRINKTAKDFEKIRNNALFIFDWLAKIIGDEYEETLKIINGVGLLFHLDFKNHPEIWVGIKIYWDGQLKVFGLSNPRLLYKKSSSIMRNCRNLSEYETSKVRRWFTDFSRFIKNNANAKAGDLPAIAQMLKEYRE